MEKIRSEFENRRWDLCSCFFLLYYVTIENDKIFKSGKNKYKFKTAFGKQKFSSFKNHCKNKYEILKQIISEHESWFNKNKNKLSELEQLQFLENLKTAKSRL